MDQIIKNYMSIFIVPFLIGAAVRFLCQRTKRAYLITAVFTVLAVIGWVSFYTVPSHGSELYGIIALLVTSADVGGLLAGLIIRLKRNEKDEHTKAIYVFTVCIIGALIIYCIPYLFHLFLS